MTRDRRGVVKVLPLEAAPGLPLHAAPARDLLLRDLLLRDLLLRDLLLQDLLNQDLGLLLRDPSRVLSPADALPALALPSRRSAK